uniref:Uncharacterized protein n=1 Tax=Anguilla anguilla TaxID=7936 RepID=A0A0E9R1S3_ANGAN
MSDYIFTELKILKCIPVQLKYERQGRTPVS